MFSALFAALTAIFAKVGIKGVDTDLATAIRTVVILILAWAIVLYKGSGQGIHSLTKVNWTFLILSVCYFRALQLGKVSQVAPVDKLSVALAIILSMVFLGEQVTLKTAAGAALIILGTIVLIFA